MIRTMSKEDTETICLSNESTRGWIYQPLRLRGGRVNTERLYAGSNSKRSIGKRPETWDTSLASMYFGHITPSSERTRLSLSRLPASSSTGADSCCLLCNSRFSSVRGLLRVDNRNRLVIRDPPGRDWGRESSSPSLLDLKRRGLA